MPRTDEEETTVVLGGVGRPATKPVEPPRPPGGRDFGRRRWRNRWRRVRPFVYSALVLAILGTSLWLVFGSSVLSVRTVRVEGLQAISQSRVEKVARVPMGRPLARLDLAAIRARVETIPAVRSVAVSRSWPHTVRVEVTERVPLAVVNRGSGLQAVDDEGVLFGSYPDQPADLPLIRTSAGVSAEALAEAAQVVASLRSDIRARVEYVDVESVDRIRLRLSASGGGPSTVMWGSAEQSVEKAEVLAVLLGKAEGAREIDVSVPGRPTTR